MAAMKVLLISANKVREPYPVYPLGLDYVAGALAADHDVNVLDLNQLPAGMDLEGAIGAFGPDIVGISLRNIDNTDVADPKGFVPHYQAVTQTVRRACDAPIVLGGSGFTIFPERLMALLEADYGIMGEGERLQMLLQALEQGADPLAIKGVIGRLRDTRGGARAVAARGGTQIRTRRRACRLLSKERRHAQSANQARLPLQMRLLHLSAHRGPQHAL
jgi:hypothetical protein